MKGGGWEKPWKTPKFQYRIFYIPERRDQKMMGGGGLNQAWTPAWQS